jgi:hypothetical protein
LCCLPPIPLQIASALLVKHGLDVGKCDLVCGVKVCKGFVRHMDGSIQKIYSEDEVKFPLQVCGRCDPPGGHFLPMVEDARLQMYT